MMATDPDPAEVLRSTDEKANFQRVTRLLISGGTRLLREIFDKYCPPNDLPGKLSDHSTKKELKNPNLTKPQRDVLYPSPGVYGKSTDFDITLLFRLLRTKTICSLTPPGTGWNVPPANADYSLTADLLRIKNYRNSLYAHVNQTMDITDDAFQSFWQQISESLTRIAGQLSGKKKIEWQEAIGNFLKSPVTAEDERNVEELKNWYLLDIQVKESIENLKKSIAQEAVDCVEKIERVVREEGQATRHMLEEKLSSAATAAESQSAGTHLSFRIDCAGFAGPGPVGGATGKVVSSQESQEVVQDAEVVSLTSHQSPVVASKGSGEENVQNGGLPSSQQVLNFIALKYFQNVNPSNPEEFNGFIQYIEKVRKALIVGCEQGSLIITVKCGSLQILDELWYDYRSGHLNEMAQKFLVTEDILTAFNLSELTLATTIVEEEYIACRGYFLGSGSGKQQRHASELSTRSQQPISSKDSESSGKRKEAIRRSPRKNKGKRQRHASELSTQSQQSASSEDSESSRKRKEAIRRSPRKHKGAADVDLYVLQSAHKRQKTDTTGDQGKSDASDKVFDTEIVFALDCSPSVSKEEIQMEVEFAKQMQKSWNMSPANSVEVVYWDSAKKMAMTMTKAADYFSKHHSERQLVILITAGRLVSDPESKEDDRELLVSAFEALSSKSIKVIIVPVGLETDFRELGLIVRRPQFLFPLSGFDDMNSITAKNIVSNIRKTIDIESYAKNTFDQFSAIPHESSLWENISHCSDVMEGAWYKLYDDQTKPNKSEEIKKLIRESIDNFHATLVTENKVCISVAVFGPLGAGKSFFLNFLLNLGLPDQHQVKNGPLPSAFGSSQTPLPIYVKYDRHVQVLLHKQKTDRSPDIWFHKEELGKDTLARVNDKLKLKFQERASLSDARCIELQGPFPVFVDLKKSSRAMTRSGLHLELEVDVEFVDVPGRGDETGDESDDVRVALRKADIVLFFDNGKSGRPVSAEDIAQIFRRREEFEFTTRPKLVHIVNDRNPSFSLSGKFDLLKKEKKENLDKAWSHFLSSSKKDDSVYKEVRAKLPQLNGEDLLEKMSSESEIIYFHPENPDFLESFKEVIREHVQSVKIKQTIHPFLQNVHWAAKMLQKRIRYSLSTKKKNMKPVNINPREGPFEILSDMYQDEACDLITSFTDEVSLPLDSDITTLHEFLYNTFLLSSETRAFLVEILKDSLNNCTITLMISFIAENWSTLQDVPTDDIELVEMACKSKVQQFCATTAPTYLSHVLHKRKNLFTFKKAEKNSWKLADYEEKKDLCQNFLQILLFRAEESLMDEIRDDQYKKSHFQLIKKLKESVAELLTCKVRSYEDAFRADCLKLLDGKLPVVIEFCINTIRDFNPHPSLNVQASFTLPEKMKNAYDDDRVPLQSCHENIIKEITELLLNPRAQAAKRAIKRLEAMLNFKHGDLKLPQQRVDRRSWALALVNVLCDEDHFNTPLDPSLVQDRNNPEIEKLLDLARKRLFAHQKSYVTCKIVDEPSLPDNEIHLRKNDPAKCLEVLVSSSTQKKLDDIHKEFKDPANHLAPIFIPTIRPGPTPDIQGNYFLEEDPWSKVSPIDGSREEDECDSVDDLNIFLVVEKRHLFTLQRTIDVLRHSAESKIKLMYIVLPQDGRGIGVTRAIIKSLAECFKFSLYWTIDDDIQFMYQFDGNDRRWHKCSIARGLLFGQRVFQTCLEKTMKKLSEDERHELLEKATEGWPTFARKTKRNAISLLIDRTSFAEVQKNPALLHTPFANISEDCGGDSQKEDILKKHEQEFVDECRKRLFEDAVNHIAGVSLAHVSTRRADYMSKYPTADYMPSEQRYQVVLNNACALKGKNFVTDEVIFHKDEFQVQDQDKCNTPYWGIRDEDRSFCRALKVSGVIGYQVIRIVHSHKKLRNVFDRVGPSYIRSLSPHTSEDEDDDDVKTH